MKAFRAWLFLGLISACSSDNTATDGGATDAGNDVTVTKDAGSDVTQGTDTGADVTVADASADVTTSDASDGGSSMFTLTINDYINWCNVSVDGQDAGNTPGLYHFAPDASVSLHGDTQSSQQFYWGYWQTATLADGGKDTNMNVTIQMNGDVTILACCPDLNTPLSCP